jgi:hypothetical protein
MSPRSLRRRLPHIGSLAAALAIAAASSRAAETPPVLLVVPAGAEVSKVEAARSSVPSSRALLTVGATERVALREGIELVVDHSFPEAPSSDLVVVLPGEASGEEEFLAARRKTARVILFLGDSPLLRRLKGDGSRGALLLVGGPEAIPALAGSAMGIAPAAALSPSSEAPRGAATATPRPTSARQGTPTPAESAVRRYFSARTPTPTPPR